MPVVFGKCAIQSKGRPLSVMARLKASVVEVKAEDNYLAHALIIAILKGGNNPNYTSYRDGRKVHRVVLNLLFKTGIDLY